MEELGNARSPGGHPGHPSGQWLCVVKSLPGMERSGMKETTLFTNNRGVFSTQLAWHQRFSMWNRKEGTRPEGRNMSRRPPACCGGSRDNKGPAGTLHVLRATRLWGCPPPPHTDTDLDAEDGWGAKVQGWSVIPLETAFQNCCLEPLERFGKRNRSVRCDSGFGVT